MNEIGQENSLAIVDNDIKEFFNNISKKCLTHRRQKTPSKNIKTRQGKQGKQFKYASRNIYEEWLDKNYPGWSYNILPEHSKEQGGFFYVAGTLTVYEGEKLLKRTITEYGCDEIEFNKENKPVIIMYLKNASTDALKRCVMRLGGMNDIHGDQEDVEIKMNDEDIMWFINDVIPVLIKRKVSGLKIYNNLNSFVGGFLLKETIENSINK